MYCVHHQPGQVTPGLDELHALCDKQAAEIAAKPFDRLAFIMAFEAGEIESDEELASGFQHLIDDGTVWQLQGFYGRYALSLIGAGLCHE